MRNERVNVSGITCEYEGALWLRLLLAWKESTTAASPVISLKTLGCYSSPTHTHKQTGRCPLFSQTLGCLG